MDIIKLIKLSNDAKIYVYLFCDITLKIIFPYVYLNNFIAQQVPHFNILCISNIQQNYDIIRMINLN